jgi:Uma2 family endonuclease
MSIAELYAPAKTKEIIYPESDGKPMADNSIQFRHITVTVTNLEILLQDNPDAFAIGDMLWYPEEGNNTLRTAPDAMVVFGRPKGDRGAYLQWKEGGIAPQVVFEILSPGNRRAEMEQKFNFYDRYGVEEYYLYDPDRGRLQGWLRQRGALRSIERMQGWRSPRLGIRFDLEGKELKLYYPDGRRFSTLLELDHLREAAEARAQAAEARAEAAEARLRELEARLKGDN